MSNLENYFFIVMPIETIFDKDGVRLLPREFMTHDRIVNAHRIAVGNATIDDPVVRANAVLLRALGGIPLKPRGITMKDAAKWAAERMEFAVDPFCQYETGRTLTCTREHIWAQVDARKIWSPLAFVKQDNWWKHDVVKKVMIRKPNPEMAQDPAHFFGVDDYVPPFDPFFYDGPEHNADLIDPEAL